MPVSCVVRRRRAPGRAGAMASFTFLPQPDEPDVQVVAKWHDGRASLAEVMAVRRLLPTVHHRPVSQVLEQARASAGWVVAVCQPLDAPRLAQQAAAVGLVVVVEPFPFGRERLPEWEARWGCPVPASWLPG